MSNTAIQEQEFDHDQKMDLSIWKRLFRYVLRCKSAFALSIVSNMSIAIIDSKFVIPPPDSRS